MHSRPRRDSCWERMAGYAWWHKDTKGADMSTLPVRQPVRRNIMSFPHAKTLVVVVVVGFHRFLLSSYVGETEQLPVLVELLLLLLDRSWQHTHMPHQKRKKEGGQVCSPAGSNFKPCVFSSMRNHVRRCVCVCCTRCSYPTRHSPTRQEGKKKEQSNLQLRE